METNYYATFEASGFYHVVNRAIGNEQLFKSHDNFDFFLNKMEKYILPVADIYAYCLLPNHFHFLIKTHDEQTLQKLYTNTTGKSSGEDYQHQFIAKQWSNLLNSYSKSYNDLYHRMGSLFLKSTKRVSLSDINALCYVAFYIHKNPVHHGYTDSMSNWKWTSYNSILSSQKTYIKKDEILEWFGGLYPFIAHHKQAIEVRNPYMLE